MNVLALVGSLRAGSLNHQLALAALDAAPEDATTTVWGRLAELPFYNEDVDGDDVPEPVDALRRAVADADALVLVTPEYNGSVSGVLKNAIDWVSRPRGEAAIAGKPTLVLAASPSPRGAQWAREDAVRILGVAGADVRDHLGIGSAAGIFAAGPITEEHHLVLAGLVGGLLAPAAAAA